MARTTEAFYEDATAAEAAVGFPTAAYEALNLLDYDTGRSSTAYSFTVPASAPYAQTVHRPLAQTDVTVTVGGASRTVIFTEGTPSSGQVAVSPTTGVVTFHSTDASGAAVVTMKALQTVLNAGHLMRVEAEIEAVQQEVLDRLRSTNTVDWTSTGESSSLASSKAMTIVTNDRGSTVTAAGSPLITAGTFAGQRLLLANDGPDAIAIPDGSGVDTGGNTITITVGEIVEWVWDATLTVWKLLPGVMDLKLKTLETTGNATLRGDVSVPTGTLTVADTGTSGSVNTLTATATRSAGSGGTAYANTATSNVTGDAASLFAIAYRGNVTADGTGASRSMYAAYLTVDLDSGEDGGSSTVVGTFSRSSGSHNSTCHGGQFQLTNTGSGTGTAIEATATSGSGTRTGTKAVGKTYGVEAERSDSSGTGAACRAENTNASATADVYLGELANATVFRVLSGGGLCLIDSDNQTITAAGNTVAHDRKSVARILGSGTITLTSTPSIAAGEAGQILIVVNGGGPAITLQDEGTLAGSNLELGATTRQINTNSMLMLMYHPVTSKWHEISYVA